VTRTVLSALLGAVLRALGAALAALVASGVESGAALTFLPLWTAIFFVSLALAAPIEAFLTRRFLGPPAGGRGVRTAGRGALGGALAFVFVWARLPIARALGPLGALGAALGGAVAALLFPWRRDEPALPVASAPALLLAAYAAAYVAIDPAARERYAANRLDETALAAPPPFPGRDPATLSDLEIATALARTFVRTHPPARLRWSWEEAVAVDGLLAEARRTGDSGPREYARAWIDAHLAEALEGPLWADAAAPAAAVLAVGGDARIVERVDRYVREEAPRTRAGAISHPGLLARGLLPRQAWVDSLYMHGIYLDRRGASWALDEAARLGRAMAASLRDPESGLFRHAAVDVGPLTVRLPVERTFWARGNGWALYFAVDHAIARKGPPPWDLEPALASLLAAQDPASGLWRTDLLGPAEPANPLETSASALFVAALRRGRAAGLFAKDARIDAAIARGLAGLRARIRWDRGHPSVVGVSTGTHPGFRAYYRAVPQDENVAHGVGAVLLALTAED
jgi:unsaturated rhamnogalacturonyl hydrolase